MSRREAVVLKTISVGLAGLSHVAPVLAGRIATYLWFTPFPFARPRSPQIPPGARRITFESAGSVVHGYEIGDGSRTALLIHGWAGSSRQYRRIALRLTEQGYRCVVIDLPAHGIEAGRSTHAFEMADAIEIAGNALGKVDIVVAHSLGVMATAVAMQRSLKADRLVLLAPGLRPHQALESFAATLRLRPVVTKAVEHSMEDRFGQDLWDRIPKGILDMNVPGRTLIIHDVDDDMVPIEEAKLLSERWGVGLVSTQGHGHNGVLRASEVIDQIATLASAEPVSA
ncbi:MAG: alpha/beta fold hydrolase [Actinobacteria bacterium]|nr:alpha/beta fold hydrolase [Actinomycetota bacterium]MCZ6739922.1 alpha/beta fold hydrolase [Actinomycetota bacterium]